MRYNSRMREKVRVPANVASDLAYLLSPPPEETAARLRRLRDRLGTPLLAQYLGCTCSVVRSWMSGSTRRCPSAGITRLIWLWESIFFEPHRLRSHEAICLWGYGTGSNCGPDTPTNSVQELKEKPATPQDQNTLKASDFEWD